MALDVVFDPAEFNVSLLDVEIAGLPAERFQSCVARAKRTRLLLSGGQQPLPNALPSRGFIHEQKVDRQPVKKYEAAQAARQRAASRSCTEPNGLDFAIFADELVVELPHPASKDARVDFFSGGRIDFEFGHAGGRSAGGRFSPRAR